MNKIKIKIKIKIILILLLLFVSQQQTVCSVEVPETPHGVETFTLVEGTLLVGKDTSIKGTASPPIWWGGRLHQSPSSGTFRLSFPPGTLFAKYAQEMNGDPVFATGSDATSEGGFIKYLSTLFEASNFKGVASGNLYHLKNNKGLLITRNPFHGFFGIVVLTTFRYQGISLQGHDGHIKDGAFVTVGGYFTVNKYGPKAMKVEEIEEVLLYR